MRYQYLACIALTLAPAVAQEIYHVGGGVSSPSIAFRIEPAYSEPARKATLEGTVQIRLVVGEDGLPRDLRVVKPLGLGLDENAVAAVSQWKFTPGMKEGNPVPVEVNVEVSYRLLLDDRLWRLAGATFTAPEGATQPSLQRSPVPGPKGIPESGAVRVAFDISAQGIPANIQVEYSSNPKWDDEVIALIREWRFEAAIRSGEAVPSRGLFDFSRGEPFNSGRLDLRDAPRPNAPPVKKKRM